MRLSLWQQFSSNHSADFTVVGTFDTPDKAVEAANEIQRIVDYIEIWWKNLSSEEFEVWRYRTDTPQLTPPEIELRQKYGVEWPFSLCWFHWAWDTDSPVLVSDKAVVIEPTSNTNFLKSPMTMRRDRRNHD